jgi:glycine cleavage system H lipoate-binding protein
MDFLATKGIEYLMVIGYLLVLIPFWWLLSRAARAGERAAAAPALAPVAAMRSWFRLPEGLHFHRGHTWALPEAGGVFKIGVDDFAERLLGPAEALELPAPGTVVDQGQPAWSFRVGGHRIPVLSPVRGEVVALNPEVERDPGVVSEDPYGRGWLMKVRVPAAGAAMKNLLSGKLARTWMDEAAEGLSAMMGPKLGPVLQDGGIPVPGFARQLSPERWHEIAAELLLTE